MTIKRDKEYIKDIEQCIKRTKNIIVEKSEEIVKDIIGLELTEFEVLSKNKFSWHEEAYNAEEEIFLTFGGGKEMRIYIEDGKLIVYTD